MPDMTLDAASFSEADNMTVPFSIVLKTREIWFEVEIHTCLHAQYRDNALSLMVYEWTDIFKLR
jgi:hypothetical protein